MCFPPPVFPIPVRSFSPTPHSPTFLLKHLSSLTYQKTKNKRDKCLFFFSLKKCLLSICQNIKNYKNIYSEKCIPITVLPSLSSSHPEALLLLCYIKRSRDMLHVDKCVWGTIFPFLLLNCQHIRYISLHIAFFILRLCLQHCLYQCTEIKERIQS